MLQNSIIVGSKYPQIPKIFPDPVLCIRWYMEQKFEHLMEARGRQGCFIKGYGLNAEELFTMSASTVLSCVSTCRSQGINGDYRPLQGACSSLLSRQLISSVFSLVKKDGQAEPG